MNELSRNQFDVLSNMAISKEVLTQRQLMELTSSSLGTINKEVHELIGLGLYDGNKVTENGFLLLEK